MILKLTSILYRARNKTFKLAANEENRRELLRQIIEDSIIEDSGIDSDDSVHRLRVQINFDVQLNDTGSSDEELQIMVSPSRPRPKWTERRYEDQMLNESGSSDDELVLQSPKPNWPKRNYDDPLENMEQGLVDREPLMPMLARQRPRSDDSEAIMPESPDRSSPPLCEVELTASDEDEDSSVLELVIPLQSNRSNSTPTSLSVCLSVTSLICSVFCCFRD